MDKSNLKQTIIDLPKQLGADLEFFNQLNVSRRQFNKIILCGVGGSSIAADLFRYLELNEYAPLTVNAPLRPHRDYDLPPNADKNSLIICASYSGNTEEVISSYKKAKELDLEVAGLTSGGQLADLFQQNKTPWVKISDGAIPPRHGLGYQIAALVKLFVAYGLLLHTAKDALNEITEKIQPQEIAENAEIFIPKLLNKIPIIYSSQNNAALARVMKIKFNEDAKIPSFCNYFPELNHNEMTGWEKPLGPFHFLFLTDANDHPRTQKRMRLTADLLKKLGWNCDLVEIGGDEALEKMLWSLVFGDWLAYGLALARGIDPTPVKMVEDFKKDLDKN